MQILRFAFQKNKIKSEWVKKCLTWDRFFFIFADSLVFCDCFIIFLFCKHRFFFRQVLVNCGGHTMYFCYLFVSKLTVFCFFCLFYFEDTKLIEVLKLPLNSLHVFFCNVFFVWTVLFFCLSKKIWLHTLYKHMTIDTCTHKLWDLKKKRL